MSDQKTIEAEAIEIIGILRDELSARLRDQKLNIEAELESLETITEPKRLPSALIELYRTAEFYREAHARELVFCAQNAFADTERGERERAGLLAYIRAELDVDSPYYRKGEQ